MNYQPDAQVAPYKQLSQDMFCEDFNFSSKEKERLPTKRYQDRGEHKINRQ